MTFTAGLGWRALLSREQRPGHLRTFRLRLMKEAVNALLPVAQVGGDVVRARLSVTRALPLRTSAAVCVIDVIAGLSCLAAFVLMGLALASVVIADERVDRLALQLAGSGILLGAGVVLGERLGVLRLVDRATARSEGALGQLSGVGHDVEALFRRPARLARSTAWHLLSWSLGVLETWMALRAVGLAAGWLQAGSRPLCWKASLKAHARSDLRSQARSACRRAATCSSAPRSTSRRRTRWPFR